MVWAEGHRRKRGWSSGQKKSGASIWAFGGPKIALRLSILPRVLQSYFNPLASGSFAWFLGASVSLSVKQKPRMLPIRKPM
jgi:hypothetical protein